ncbi:MAG: hypothetical protein ACP5NW_02950 [Candidatus Woesearchaeota archaeon]
MSKENTASTEKSLETSTINNTDKNSNQYTRTHQGKQSEKLRIQNYGAYYYPDASLEKNLAEIIIFTENNTKKNIPNGSVFTYTGTGYDPSILKSDVGCGISAVMTESLDFDEASRLDILKAVDSVGIHIGQGNHFLDFTTAHPAIRRKDIAANMIYLHSDFNNENIVPTNYSQAKALENRAKEKRREYLDKLARILGISAEFYKDWTHNSVNREDEHTIYRKGAINLKETEGVGALAMDPIHGIYLYYANFDEWRSSMQHGLGRIGSRSELQSFMTKESVGIARGYKLAVERSSPQLKEALKQTYNPINMYLANFGNKELQIGVCIPQYIVTTKG